MFDQFHIDSDRLVQIAFGHKFVIGMCIGAYLFGAGSITDAHSDHEFVTESDLHKAVTVYVELIEHLLKLK